VCCANGEIAAYAAVCEPRDNDLPPGFGEIAVFGTLVRYRRQGHGERLMERVREEATKRSWRALSLWVVDRNAPARAFYENQGFRSDGTSRVEDRLGFPATVLRYRT